MEYFESHDGGRWYLYLQVHQLIDSLNRLMSIPIIKWIIINEVEQGKFWSPTSCCQLNVSKQLIESERERSQAQIIKHVWWQLFLSSQVHNKHKKPKYLSTAQLVAGGVGE